MKISEHTLCFPPPHHRPKTNWCFFYNLIFFACACCVHIPFYLLTASTNVSKSSRRNLSSIGRFWRKLEQFVSQFFLQKRSNDGGKKSRNRHDTPVLSQHDRELIEFFYACIRGVLVIFMWLMMTSWFVRCFTPCI